MTCKGPDEEAKSRDGETACEVQEHAWSCPAPEGRHDLRIEATGYIPRYFWDVAIQGGLEHDLGALSLITGSSIVGRVLSGRGEPIGGAQVTAKPDLADVPLRPDEGRLTRFNRSKTTNEHGFFQLEGLREGAYVLKASHDGGTSAHFSVTVGQDQETSLGSPLVLIAPIDFEVAVAPAVDQHDQPWSLELTATKAPARRSGRSDEAGTWTAANLEPAEYFLFVRDSRGGRVHSERLQIKEHAPRREIRLEMLQVHGRVYLGDEPLEARLYFGGKSGGTSLRIDSDEEGAFSGSLPRDGLWDIDVVARKPEVFRRLTEVPVERGSSGEAELKIELPGTSLEGSVINEAGTQIRNAAVLIKPVGSPEKVSNTRSNGEGHFSVAGFEPGSYQIEARLMGESLASDTIEILLDEETSTSVTLILRDGRELRGILLGPSGEAVVGAPIFARPMFTDQRGVILLPQARSGADGSFSLRLAPGTPAADITVLAPGFLFKRERRQISEDEELVIVLESEGGGRLVILESENEPSFILHDGVVTLDLGTLKRWALLNGQSTDASPLTIPRMPSGLYALCSEFPNEATCTEAHLSPFGEVRLSHERENEEE